MAMNYERDRFVAFAFAAADAFLEIDHQGKIKFAAGALDWLAGRNGSDLIDRDLKEYCCGRSRKILRAAAESARTRGRFGPVTLRFQGKEGKVRPIAVYGTCLPQYPDSAFLSLRATSLLGPQMGRDDDLMDEEAIILDAEAFKAMATGLMAQIRDDQDDFMLTLMEVRGLKETLEALDPEAADELVEKIATHLCAASLDGSSAGQLASQNFGIIHGADLNVAAALKEIQNFDNGSDLTSKAATISLEGTGLSEADRVKSLVYAIDAFSNDPDGFAASDLNASYRALLDQTRSRLTIFRRVLSEQQFDIVVQPVIGLDSKRLHHYEALARFGAKDIETLPQEFISEAEDLGVICDFDMAMCRRIVDRIEKAHASGKRLSMSVNVSIQSLASDRFVAELLELLAQKSDIHDCLIFEVTDATKINNIEAIDRVLSQISQLGHLICLDDFGTAEHGYQYLRALAVDIVKIDGVHVRQAFSNPNARALLRSMAQLCREIGIQTVGEAVETASEAKFLRDIGIDYGQGYFFGKPAVGISENLGPYIF